MHDPPTRPDAYRRIRWAPAIYLGSFAIGTAIIGYAQTVLPPDSLSQMGVAWFGAIVFLTGILYAGSAPCLKCLSPELFAQGSILLL